MRRGESNSTFTKSFHKRAAEMQLKSQGGCFLGGLFYCKTPMGANKIFYCVVSRAETKKKKAIL